MAKIRIEVGEQDNGKNLQDEIMKSITASLLKPIYAKLMQSIEDGEIADKDLEEARALAVQMKKVIEMAESDCSFGEVQETFEKLQKSIENVKKSTATETAHKPEEKKGSGIKWDRNCKCTAKDFLSKIRFEDAIRILYTKDSTNMLDRSAYRMLCVAEGNLLKFDPAVVRQQIPGAPEPFKATIPLDNIISIEKL